jgi:hypothetical protein
LDTPEEDGINISARWFAAGGRKRYRRYQLLAPSGGRVMAQGLQVVVEGRFGGNTVVRSRPARGQVVLILGLSVARMLRGILTRSLTLRGYINTEFVAEHRESFLEEISPLVESGRVKYREDVSEGLESAPAAFIDMLAGRNFCKALVRVS